MRVTDKNDVLFRTIQHISDVSFDGIERPPVMTLKYEFDTSEVFVFKQLPENSGSMTVRSTIVAFALVNVRADEPYLWSLAVLPEFRNRKIASRLLKEVIAYYTEKHAKTLSLSVNVDNPAQKLYFDHGFRTLRVLPRYYGEASGLRMRRYL